MTRMIRIPIFPSPRMVVLVPAGAKLVTVSTHIHDYFLHAVCADPVVVGYETRGICAVLDETDMPREYPFAYLGWCRKSGSDRVWHFFDMGVVREDAEDGRNGSATAIDGASTCEATPDAPQTHHEAVSQFLDRYMVKCRADAELAQGPRAVIAEGRVTWAATIVSDMRALLSKEGA